MRVHVADHPLVAHKLTTLRDERTDSPTFRRLAEELVTLLAYEATREVRTVPFEVRTPVAPRGRRTAGAAAPARRADPAGRARACWRGWSGCCRRPRSGFLGMVRDESTLVATTYADRLPEDLADRQVYVLDPMLATGGTLVAAIELLLARGAHDVTAICLLAAPEGLAHLRGDVRRPRRRRSRS